jgi:hypothetical protein
MTDTLFTPETPGGPPSPGSRPPAALSPAAGGTARPQPRVIGLDISLASTGVAGVGWTELIRTGDRRGEDRLDYIVACVLDYTRSANFVAIEGPSYGSALQNGHDEMAAARWMVRCELRRRNIPYAIVPPDNRTIYATGRARWKSEDGKKLTAAQVKGKVRDAVARRYGVECEGTGRYDRADAYVLLAMARDYLGYPLAPVPATHSRALAKVAWPEVSAP